MGLVSELKRRNVFRMAVLYLVGAWLVMQVAEVIIALANLPYWIGPIILAVLSVGFPISLIFSWFYEITPEGLSLETDVESGKSITHITGRRMDVLVISLLCAAVVLFSYDKWWAHGPAELSIAVLPFQNMSNDPDQEYFSDGISEELLNSLARIPELSVISRTSAFSYKGKDVRLSEIARELNVAHILEGSVRKVGKEVRVTAQLIEASSDTHLWSQTYDRTINDIFLIQDEIAKEVADQLRITLLGNPPEMQMQDIDPEIYALFLRARYLSRQGTDESWGQSIKLFQEILAIAPTHAAAWDGLAYVYINQTNNSQRPIQEGYELARDAASKALVLDPKYALAHARLGWIAMHYDGDLQKAANHYERALALAPTNTVIIFGAASLAMTLDRIDTAIELEKYATLHDPLYAVGHNNLGDSYLSARQYQKAIDSFRAALSISPGYVGAHYRIGVAHLLDEKLDLALREMEQENFEAWRLLGLAMTYHALGQVDESDAALAGLIGKYEKDAAYNIAYVFAFRGDSDLAFQWLEKAVLYSDPGLAEIANEPLFDNIREDTRWLPFLETIGKSPRQLYAIDFNVTLPK